MLDTNVAGCWKRRKKNARWLLLMRRGISTHTRACNFPKREIRERSLVSRFCIGCMLVKEKGEAEQRQEGKQGA